MCDADKRLEKKRRDDTGGHGWQILANKLNIHQHTTFQLYAIIDNNVVVV